MVDSRSMSMAGAEMQQLHLTPEEQQTISQLTEMLRRDYGDSSRTYVSTGRRRAAIPHRSRTWMCWY